MSAPNKPPRVPRYEYWVNAPPALSKRCVYWLGAFARGWRPNRRTTSCGYDESAQRYGVYIWEYLYVISPTLAGAPLEPDARRLVEAAGAIESLQDARDRVHR